MDGVGDIGEVGVDRLEPPRVRLAGRGVGGGVGGGALPQTRDRTPQGGCSNDTKVKTRGEGR